jgi:eukaryotic-like serine/threonine-protein kinase
MLEGRPPYVSNSPYEVFAMHRSAPLPPITAREVHADVVALVSRLAAKSKEQRFPSAELFLRDLDRILVGGGSGLNR